MKKITLGLALILTLIVYLIPGTNSRIEGRYRDLPKECLMPMNYGYCRAKMKRFFFNANRNRCSPFYFGGCAGNANNFETLEECNEICGGIALTEQQPPTENEQK